jgi:hypothetical protein
MRRPTGLSLALSQESGSWRSRQIDRKHAPSAGQVEYSNLAAARLDALQAYREPEAKPSLVAAALLKRPE